MEQDARRVALFPLSVVLLPSTPLPLHIFEDRYRLMVTHCIENETPFGVVYTGTNQARATGCLARIERVLRRHDDGRMDILCLGYQRFRTRSTDSNSDPWLNAEVDFFDDHDSHKREELALPAREMVKQLELYAAIVGGTIEREALLKLDPQKLSFVAGASAMFSLEQKQRLLELESTAARLNVVRDILTNAIARRRMARAAQRVIGKEENIDHLLN